MFWIKEVKTYRTLIICWLLSSLIFNSVVAQEIIPLPAEPTAPSNPLVKTDPAAKGGFGVIAAESVNGGVLPRPGYMNSIVRVPPLNDNFAAAEDIGVLAASTNLVLPDIDEATVEQDELTFCGGYNNSVWYTFSLPADTVIDVATNTSTYDSVITLYYYTPADGLSFRVCNDDYGTPGAAIYDFAAKAGTYYVQVMDYGSTALSSDTELYLNLNLSSTGVPKRFTLVSPYAQLLPLGLDEFVWTTSERAATYQLVVQRMGSDDGNPLGAVIDLDGLTPAADSDGLVCAEGGYCEMTLPPAEAANLIGNTDDYLWYVMAKNANGSIRSYGFSAYTAFEFGIDADTVPLDFEPLSPEGQYSVAPDTFTWEPSIGAETYEFDMDGIVSRDDYIFLTGLTAAADGDELVCDDDLCTLTLTAEQYALLTDFTYYTWTISAVNIHGARTPPSVELHVFSVFYPFAFELHYPYYNYFTDASDLAFFRITEAYHADTYAIEVNRTAPIAETIISRTGLTPTDTDDDRFYCAMNGTEQNPGFCFYYPTEEERLQFTDGDYEWSAVATNSTGDTDATPASHPFYVVSEFAYDLLTPPNDTVFAQASDFNNFTWDDIVSASWTPIYQSLYFYSLDTTRTSPMHFLTPAADFDRLTCAAGSCTLAITGTELGLFRSDFYWFTYLFGSVPGASTSMYPDNGSFYFTVGDVPTSDQLLLNNSFETKVSRAALPADWSAKNLVKAGVKCNKDKDGDGTLDKIFANEGSCAFRMKGIGSGGKLQQSPAVENLIAGDTLRLASYVQGKNAVEGAQIRLRVKYATAEKTKINLEVTPGTYDYTYLEEAVILPEAPTKIKVQLRYNGVGGKVLFDPVSLYVELPLPRDNDGLLALPKPFTNGLDTRQGDNSNRLDAQQ